MVLDGEVLKCPGGQWYEPITETRVFVRFPNRKQKTNFVLSVFHLGKKKHETGEPTRCFSVGFVSHVPCPNKAYIYVWKPHYNVWINHTRHSQNTAHSQQAAHIPQQHSSTAGRHTEEGLAAGSTGHRALCAARLRAINHVECRRQCCLLRLLNCRTVALYLHKCLFKLTGPC